jgi:hypothetical protein
MSKRETTLDQMADQERDTDGQDPAPGTTTVTDRPPGFDGAQQHHSSAGSVALGVMPGG